MKPSSSFLCSPLLLPRFIQTALGVILAGSSAQAVDYYKANNVTSLTSSGSWWLDAAGTTPATNAPTNTTSSSAVCIWNNLVTGPNTITLVDVGMHTLRILNPGGLVTLDGSSTLNKTLSFANGGGIDMSNATQDLTIINLSTASDKGLRLSGSNAVMNINVASGRTLTVGSRVAVNGGSSGATVNFSGTGTSIFNAAFQPSHAVINAGEVQFNNAGGSTRLSTNTTNVYGGRLVVNNATGSATGSGAVNIKNTATLTGQGIMSGLVTIENGGTIIPKENAIGTLTAGSLTLAAGSKIKWESDGTQSDLIAVNTSAGLTINGGTVELYEPGTTTPFSGIGTFNLISYSGAITGAGVASLAVAESSKIAGRTYSIQTTGSFVTVRIEVGSRPQSYWNVDEAGTWSVPDRWTSVGVPNAISAIANLGGILGTPITAPRTVTLGGDTTVGVLNFDSAQPFTVSGANTLTFDDGDATPSLHVESGSHTIAAPVSFPPSGLLVDVENAASTLTLQEPVNSNDLGTFGKSGAGTLILSADNGYAGLTSNGAGTLQLGSGGATGSVGGPIANSGTLRFNRSTDYVQSPQISGPGSLDFAGSAVITLNGPNTFSGPTTISSGAVVIGDPSALQNSTLTYSTTGGTLTHADYISNVTLGGLTGDRSFPLTNAIGNPVALTVGQSNENTSYTASTSGGSTLIKSGTGTFSLTGTHTFSGATTINAGTLSLNTGADFTTAPIGFFVGTAVGTSKLVINGGALHSSGTTLVPNSSLGIEISAGSASFDGGLTSDNNSDFGNFIVRATGGTLSTASMVYGRGNLDFGPNPNPVEPTAGSTSAGLCVNGGAVNISGALSIGKSASNSSVSARIDSGSLTVGGATTVAINSTGRWSALDIVGGTFTSTDTSVGVRLGGTTAGQVIMLVRGGVAKAERIQFGQPDLTGKATLSQTGGSLYVGAGGMVVGSTAITAQLRLGGGTLGATADSTSTVPVSLTGNVAITGADALDSPHTVTFSGNVDGSGGLVKTGSGSVSFTSASIAFSGTVSVASGTLGLGGSTGALDVASTGTLIPRGNLSPQASSSIDGKLGIRYDVDNSLLPGRVQSLGTLTLGAGSALEISGTGTLTAPVYVLASGASGVTGTFTTVTGVPSGYSLSYNYNDGSGFPAIALVSSTASPYSLWTGSYSLTGPDTATTADPDHDGMNNLVEFALGSNPTQSSTAPVLGRNGNFLTLAFPHIAGGNLTYIVEAGDNLATWTPVATYPSFAAAGTETYIDNVAVGSTSRRMLRLRVVIAN